MKTGYIIAGLAVVGGIFYLMMRPSKVLGGTRTQGNVSNSGVSNGNTAGGILTAIGGLLHGINFGNSGPSAPPVGSPAYQYGNGTYGPGPSGAYGSSLDDAGQDYNPGPASQGTVSGGGNYGPDSADNPYGTG